MNENVPTYPYTIDRASVYMHTTPELSGEMCDELPYGTRLRVLSEAASDSGIAWVRCETAYGYCGYLGIAVVVVPFLTVGVYKNRKYCKEHAFANANAEEEAAPAVRSSVRANPVAAD